MRYHIAVASPPLRWVCFCIGAGAKGATVILRGLYTSLSGMLALTRLQETVANNMANLNTPGYRADRVSLSAFAEQLISRVETGGSGMMQLAAGQVGTLAHGSRISRGAVLEADGPVQQTGRYLDLALQGDGYFVVDTAAGKRLTRCGRFSVDSEGYLTDMAGHRVLGEDGALEVGQERFEVDQNGVLWREDKELGRLAVCTPSERLDLVKLDDGLLALRSGEPEISGDRAEDGETGWTISQNCLEGANVDPMEESARLLWAFRAFEASQKAFQIQDETLGLAVRMLSDL